MDKEKIKKRIEELKKENDEINKELSKIANVREQFVQEALTINGRILELQDQLKDKLKEI